jgi:putative lipoic acid-binding regulatory protein
MDKNSEEFYDRLREELNSTTANWPTEYLYKFIVPTDRDKVEAVEKAFDGLGAVIETTKSKTGKYTSLSINVVMPDAQGIIDKYLAVSTIEGIVSL